MVLGDPLSCIPKQSDELVLGNGVNGVVVVIVVIVVVNVSESTTTFEELTGPGNYHQAQKIGVFGHG